MAGASNIALTVAPADGSAKAERIEKWIGYDLTLGMRGASHFKVSVPTTPANRELLAQPGLRFEIRAYDSLQFVGLIDERNEHTGTSATDLMVTGRSFQGLLMDSVVPKDRRSILNLSLRDVALRLSAELWPQYITSVVTNNAANRYVCAGGSKQTYVYTSRQQMMNDNGYYRYEAATTKTAVPGRPLMGHNTPLYAGIGGEKFRTARIPVGSTCWAVIDDLCQQIGAHAWMACDGTVIISRPDYKVSPAAYGAGIVLRWDPANARATGGNVVGVSFARTISSRHSEYEVVGLGKSKKKSKARELFLSGGTIKDPSPAFWKRTTTPPYIGASKLYKPGVIEAANCQDKKRLVRLARRKLMESILSGWELSYELSGHISDGGTMYVPDSTIRVTDERNGLTDVFYIHEVSRSYSMSAGRTTTVKLWPCGLWLDNDDPSTPDDQWYAAIVPKVTW